MAFNSSIVKLALSTCDTFGPPFLAGFNPFHSILFNFVSTSDCELLFASAGCVLNKPVADNVNNNNFLFINNPFLKKIFHFINLMLHTFIIAQYVNVQQFLP